MNSLHKYVTANVKNFKFKFNNILNFLKKKKPNKPLITFFNKKPDSFLFIARTYVVLFFCMRLLYIMNSLKWPGLTIQSAKKFYLFTLNLNNCDSSLLFDNTMLLLKESSSEFFSFTGSNCAWVLFKKWLHKFSPETVIKTFLNDKSIKTYIKYFVHINVALFGKLEYYRYRKILLKRNFVLERKIFIPVFKGINRITLLLSRHIVPERDRLTLKFKVYYNYLAIFYKGMRSVLLPIFLSIILGIILLNFFSTNFLRNVGVWIIVGLIFFWLISGFNFFLKRYRFGKYTSSIQRFWKRTNAYFWLIEGFLFLLFFYYYLNSSQEVYYMWDEANLNQHQLLSLTSFYMSSFILISLIMYSFFLLLNLNSYSFKQLLIHLTIITLGIIFIFLLECYQFYYIITLFYENVWNYLGEDSVWQLDVDSPKIRAKQQYFVLALIAKYWHFLFIFFSWLFVVFKSFEQKRIHYSLFGVNLQNLILLLLLNSLFVINWLKWIFRRFYDMVYYWFFTDQNMWFSYETADTLFNFFTAIF